MNKIDKIKNITAIKGRDLPIEIKRNLVLKENEFPLNISKKWSFVRWLVMLPFFNEVFFEEKNQDFLIVDYLIFGDNPVINYVLLKKILEKSITTNRQLIVGIVKQTSFDYWGYHFYKKNKDKYQQLLNNIACLEHPLLKIIYIRDNFSVANYHHYSDSLSRYCFSLIKKQEQKHFIEYAMPNLATAQLKLKQALLWEINKIYQYMNNVQNMAFEKYDSVCFKHIISNEVFFTNYQPWLNYELDRVSYSLNIGDDLTMTAMATLFHHNVFSSKLFGSAYHIPDSFEHLEDFVEIDLKRVQLLNI